MILFDAPLLGGARQHRKRRLCAHPFHAAAAAAAVAVAVAAAVAPLRRRALLRRRSVCRPQLRHFCFVLCIPAVRLQPLLAQSVEVVRQQRHWQNRGGRRG